MSIILRDGTNAGHLLAIDASGNASVAINGSIAAGSNLIGQVEVSDGTNILFTSAHPGYVQGTVTASNPSVSTTGTAVPASATMIGATDGTNLRAIASDASGQVKVLVQNTPSVTVSGTVAVTQSTSPWVVSLTSTTITGTVAVTQSGTWNVGTVTSITNPVTVVGDAASGSAKAGNPIQGGAVFNTTQPTVTNGQVVENQSTARGALIVATGVDTFTVAGTVAVSSISGTVAVTQSTSPWVVSLTSTTITGTVAVTQSTSPWTVQGDSASGAANAGNPVKIGGVFNTTQPTVTNGQTVDQQSTARGGLIVSTGVDTFNVTVNAALPAGTNVIGHVITDTGSTTAVTGTVTVSGTVTANQGGAPWSQNLTQVAGTSLGATAVTNFGSAPAAAAVMGVNANIYSAGAAITAAAPLAVQLSQGNAVISNTNPIFSSITDGTTKVAVIAGTTALKTDQSSQAGTAITTVPVAFGTGTPSGNAPGVNSALFVGTTPVRSNQTTTATGVVDTNLAGIKGTTVVTAAAGVQQVGIVGNTAATLDSANTAATAPTNAVLTSAMYNSTVPALTTGQAVAAECDTAGSLYQNAEGRKQTYRVGVVGFTPIASATAPSISVTGSATKTIRITRIRISVTAGTGGATDISLKRFTALSGGTANSQSANIAKMDSGNAAQTAVVNQWSAAATTTTAAGIVNAERYEIVTAAVSVLPGVIEWTFGDKQGQSLVLRGTAEFAGFCITAVGTTPVADCWVEWTEE